MKRRTTRWLSLLLALCMALGVAVLRAAPSIFSTAGYALTRRETKYVNENGENKTVDAIPLNEASGSPLEGDWYVVNGIFSVEGRLEVSNNTRLILADGSKLTANAGIHVPKGARLTIYAQSAGSERGELVATGSVNVDIFSGAGIGGNTGEDSGEIAIFGGVVRAEGNGPDSAGGKGGAGIGGGSGGSASGITISGSAYVVATGRGSAAGIGGGSGDYDYTGGESAGGNGEKITISDGAYVYATGGMMGAGIGGGQYGDGKNISISGNAYIEARSDYDNNYGIRGDGSGIGGGHSGNGENITISGGAKVYATGGSGAGIGGGEAPYGSGKGRGIGITIRDYAYVEARSSISGSGIGSGNGAQDGSTIKISGEATVVATGETDTGRGIGIGGGIGGGIRGSITIDGNAHVDATGGVAGIGSEGYSVYESIAINGGEVTATGGQFGISEFGTGVLKINGGVTVASGTYCAVGGVPEIGYDHLIYGNRNDIVASGEIVGSTNGALTGDKWRALKWVKIQPASCTVKFEANGGSGTMADETVSGDSYTLPQCRFTAPAGKEFDKWDKGAVGDVIPISSDITLTAQWKDIPAVPVAPTVTTAALPSGRVNTVYEQALAATGDIPITWSLDSGTLPTGLALGTDGRITGTPTAAGTYTFTVKATNTAGSATQTLTVTIVPESAAAYIVTFDASGGTVAPASGMTGADGTLTALPTPIRAGYTFDGWYTAATGGTPVTIYTVFTADATIYAHWTVQSDNDNPSDNPSDDPSDNPSHDPDDDPFYYPGYDPSDSFSGNSTGSSASGSSGSSSGSNTKTPGTTANNGAGDTGVTSPIQHAVKEDTYGDWIERVDLPVYAQSLYETLTAGSDEEGLTKYLIKDDYFTIDPNADKAYKGKIAPVAAARTLTTEEITLFASGDGSTVFNTNQFTDQYSKVDVTQGDTRIDYAALSAGDVVKNSTFNGIFVTKIPYDAATFETQRTEVCAYITTSYQAFDRDHPEVFWLSGKSKIRMLTATVDYSGTRKQEVFFFFVLADNEGFSLRSNEYQAPGAVDAGIAQRDAAVQAILATVDTSADRHSQVRALNKWLTEHNAYNSSADLTTIGNNPHECLVALTGTIGTTGPVCDGYSRAFKVLCDRLGIPCVLVDGYAKNGTNGAGEAHMWNNVQMNDGSWYGVDVTWNDPLVAGQASVAVSGYENENYLLVGKDTEIKGLTFGVSHPETDRVSAGGVAFANGSYLSPVAYAANTVLPFADIAADAYYYDAVAWAYGNGVTEGMSNTEFGPRTAVTRGQAMTFLWRAAGKPAPGSASNPFADVPAGEYYADAVRWAVEQGITVGTSDTTFSPAASVKNAEMLAFLARAMGAVVAGDGWQQAAIDWGIENGPLTGVSSVPEAEGACPRGNVVFFIWRVYKGK